MEQTHDAKKEVYKAMAQLYVEHPEFRKQLDPFHPDLTTFMAESPRKNNEYMTYLPILTASKKFNQKALTSKMLLGKK